MGRRKKVGSLSWAAVLLLCGLAGLADPARGEMYQFTDSEGVIHFSNVPTDPRYRRQQNPAAVIPLGPEEIHQTILNASRRHRLDPALVKAVIKVESDFNAQAVSSAGAMGLMQLMPATVSTYNVRDPFNPSENIAGGAQLLSSLLSRFNGDLTLALAAYHAGAKRVESYGQVPPIENTRRYIQKVMAAYKTYRGKTPSEKAVYKVFSPTGHEIYTNVPEQYQDTRRYRVAYAQ